MDFDDIMDFSEPILPRRKRRNKVLSEGATTSIEDATHVQTDPEIIRKMDAESIRKSAEQQENEVGVMGYAREMIAGPCDDEKGPTLTKKRR